MAGGAIVELQIIVGAGRARSSAPPTPARNKVPHRGDPRTPIKGLPAVEPHHPQGWRITAGAIPSPLGEQRNPWGQKIAAGVIPPCPGVQENPQG